jgi:hypothetical protein
MPTTFQAGRKGDLPGLLPDPTLGGILVSAPVDLGADRDGDGAPDFIDGYSWFFPDYLRGYTWSTWDGQLGLNLQVQVIGTGYRFFSTSDGVNWVGGSWAIDSSAKNILVLTWDAVQPSGVKSVRFEADRIRDDGFQGQAHWLNAAGGSLANTYEHWNVQ